MFSKISKLTSAVSILVMLLECSRDSVKTIPVEPGKPLNLFSDAQFTFLNLDSLNEEMLTDTSNHKDHAYINTVKRFTTDHCAFFRTGCSGTFFDEHVFLVSKQPLVNGILPIIIHDSKDFNYYHSTLFTLNKNNKKVDSVDVSLEGSGMQSDEPAISYKMKVISRFQSDKIITTELKYWYYADNDSTITKDSTIIIRQISGDGKIRVIKKQKII